MAKLKLKFAVDDPAVAGGNGGKVVIPNGQYQGMFVSEEYKETAKGGHYIDLTLLITHGEQKNTELSIKLNVDNQNQQAVEISYQTIARISEALGMTHTPDDTEEFLKKPLMFETKTKTGKPWKNNEGVEQPGTDESVVKKWLSIPSAGNGTGQTENQNTGFSGGGSGSKAGGPAAVEKPKKGNPFAK